MQIFVALNALLYIILGLWCAIKPHSTSESVALTPAGTQGLAEYITVYGGIEFSIGVMCLLAALNPELHRVAVSALAIFYGSLFLFRGYAILRFGSDISTGWYFFAVETAGFLISLLLLKK